MHASVKLTVWESRHARSGISRRHASSDEAVQEAGDIKISDIVLSNPKAPGNRGGGGGGPS